MKSHFRKKLNFIRFSKWTSKTYKY